jgi:hypothetical protein
MFNITAKKNSYDDTIKLVIKLNKDNCAKTEILPESLYENVQDLIPKADCENSQTMFEIY